MVWGAIIAGVASVAGGLLPKKGADNAAKAQESAAEKAAAELKLQFDLARSDLQPFVAAGTGALDQIQNGATVAGMDERIRSLADSETFGALRDERLRGITSQQGQLGLRRSGAGLEEIANLDTSLLLGLEADLFGRQSGLAANAQSAAAGQAGQAIQAGQALGSLEVGKGDAIAAAKIAGATAQANIANNLGSIATSYFENS